MIEVVHVPTLDIYIDIVSTLIGKGLSWPNGTIKILEEQWNVCSYDTCIAIIGRCIKYGSRQNLSMLGHFKILNEQEFYRKYKYGRSIDNLLKDFR